MAYRALFDQLLIDSGDIVRFDANPGNGESSDRPLRSVFWSFWDVFMRTILVFFADRPRRIVRFSMFFEYLRFLAFSMVLLLCSLLCLSTTSVVGKSILRKYILLTLSRVDYTAERGALTADSIIARLTEAFVCKSIVICKETHNSNSLGFHYHVGLWNESASKYTSTPKLRGLFPEFEGRQLDVSYHKGWNTVCAYLLKEDRSPVVWGEESLELVSNAEKAELEVRTGEPFLFRPLHEVNQLRKDKEFLAFLLRTYEVFSLAVDIEFPKALHQWEKNSNYWDAAYKSVTPAVGPSSTSISISTCRNRNRSSSKCNSPSSPVAPSTTVNTPICPRKALGEEDIGGMEWNGEHSTPVSLSEILIRKLAERDQSRGGVNGQLVRLMT